MKYTMVRFALAMLLGAAVSSPASAGWGLFGHGSGGSSGGGSAGYASSGGAPSYGSSGGGVVAYAGYGSSGGGVSYGSSGGGSSGGYVAAYGSSGGASSGGSSGQPGILSRLANRIHTAHDRIHSHFAAKAARHAGSSGGGSSGGYVAHGSSGGGSSGGYASGGSSGGYYSSYSSYSGGSSGATSYGSSGGSVSYGNTGVSYGSTGSSYGSVGTSYGSVGGYYGASTKSINAASSLVSSSASVSEDTVQLNVAVPADAVVYVNDRKTTSKGENRQFVSRGLESGKTYRFEIRAELNSNGKVVADTKTVVATAGAQENVRFAFEAPKSEKVDTAVVLNVPEDAEVTLAGNATQVKGTSRTFKTSQLKAGEVWDDYEIKVKVGDQVKSQTIRLIAGDKLELSFNFDDAKDLVAAR